MQPKIPEDVREVVDTLIAKVNEQLPGAVEAVYLHGSIALQAYVPGKSDADVTVLVNRSLSEADAKRLARIHRELARTYAKPALDGSYLQFGDLSAPPRPDEYRCYFNDGKLRRKARVCDPVSLWILKRKGIRVLGPDPATLAIDVDPRQLTEYVLANMNRYWARRMIRNERLRKCAVFLPQRLVDWEMQWSVLGILRQVFTLREHDIASKTEAGRYALRCLPQQWRGTIEEALRIREGSAIRKIPSKRQRLAETVRLMKYVLDKANGEFPAYPLQ